MNIFYLVILYAISPQFHCLFRVRAPSAVVVLFGPNNIMIFYCGESSVLAKFHTPCQHEVAYPSVLPLPPEHGVGLLVREKLAPLVPWIKNGWINFNWNGNLLYFITLRAPSPLGPPWCCWPPCGRRRRPSWRHIWSMHAGIDLCRFNGQIMVLIQTGHF